LTYGWSIYYSFLLYLLFVFGEVGFFRLWVDCERGFAFFAVGAEDEGFSLTVGVPLEVVSVGIVWPVVGWVTVESGCFGHASSDEAGFTFKKFRIDFNIFFFLN
jgi:hypothetical protein